MISEYLVAVWSHSPRWGNNSVKYYECGTYDEALTFAKREAEYLDTIGREYDIDIYINERMLEGRVDYNESTKDEQCHQCHAAGSR